MRWLGLRSCLTAACTKAQNQRTNRTIKKVYNTLCIRQVNQSTSHLYALFLLRFIPSTLSICASLPTKCQPRDFPDMATTNTSNTSPVEAARKRKRAQVSYYSFDIEDDSACASDDSVEEYSPVKVRSPPPISYPPIIHLPFRNANGPHPETQARQKSAQQAVQKARPEGAQARKVLPLPLPAPRTPQSDLRPRALGARSRQQSALSPARRLEGESVPQRRGARARSPTANREPVLARAARHVSAGARRGEQGAVRAASVRRRHVRAARVPRADRTSESGAAALRDGFALGAEQG